MKKEMKNRKSERGSASVKLTAVLSVLFLAAYAGYNYIPVAYEGENLKQEMQTAVVQAMALPGGAKATDAIKAKLQKVMVANNVPTDAVVQVKPVNNTLMAQITYSKQVTILPFGLYKHTYQFNHTATPTGFLVKAN